MPDLMVGMFWGGLVMALAPLILGIGVGVYIFRNARNRRIDRQEHPSD